VSALVSGAVSGVLVVSVVLVATAWGLWLERKLAARMQSRLGPTMVGRHGLLQPIADFLKMLQKAPIVPDGADRLLFWLAPPLTAFLALAVAAFIPLAPGGGTGLDVSVLMVLALGAITVVPVWMAGWASKNKFALLGGMRAVAQGISYEVPLVLAALVPVLLAGSMDLDEIVAAQAGGRWFALWPFLPGLPAFALFFACLLAESNRIPFDIPEAESELVAGVTTEYTGMQFGLFYLAEYVHTLVGSAIAATLFLGGWDGPFAPGLHWLVGKTLVLFVVVYWVRWTFLRLRADQLMALCWRVLVPAGLLLVFAAAVWAQLMGIPGATP
jgi:NADH-quinone oxidoreductase subunit H